MTVNQSYQILHINELVPEQGKTQPNWKGGWWGPVVQNVFTILVSIQKHYIRVKITLLDSPSLRTKFGNRAFSVQLYGTVNPQPVREADSFYSFKHKLKSVYFMF